MSAKPVPVPAAGSRVRLVEFGAPFVEGVVSRVCDNGWELEVVHEEDGGGFDFWPLAGVEVVA